MMGERERRVWKGLRWLIDRLAESVLGSAVTFWGLYVVHAEFRASVRHVVARVGTWVPGAAGVAVLGSLGYVVYRYRRGLWGQAKWIGRKVRDGYMGVLWRLVVKPAREQFGVEAVRDADAIKPSFTDVLRERMRGLDADSLWVLEGALARREPDSNEALLEYPDGMRLDPPGSGKAEEKPRFEKALHGLRNIGAIVSWKPVGKETPREFSIRVVLPTADWKTLERLRVAAEAERARRSTVEMVNRLWEEVSTVEREPRGSEETASVLACKAKLRDLSGHGASVLEYLLRLYLTRAGPAIREDLSDPDVLMSPLKSLARPQLQEALQELVDEGVLQECKWSGDTLEARVAECLSKRSVAEVVFKWLQELMVEGRTGLR